MRRTGTSFTLVLLVALFAACGGGDGGPSDAFCDDLETLSDQIADGDDIDDQIDTIENDLGESAAEGEQRDAVAAVAEAYEDNDNDQADLAEEVQDELGDFAEECEIDEDEFAIAPTTTEPPTTQPPDTTDTTEPPDDSTLPPDDSPQILAREPVPGDISPEFLELANACFNGDMESCDTLFDTTPVDSPDEAYGETCGGRIDEADIQPSQCSTLIHGPEAVPADVVDQANAQACFGGDMVACDNMFNAAEVGSVDQRYGGLCGLRVAATNAFCVDIFGDVAFL